MNLIENENNELGTKIDRVSNVLAVGILIMIFFQIIGDNRNLILIGVGSLICWFIPFFLTAYSNREKEKARKKIDK